MLIMAAGERRLWVALEDLFILLSIAALWPGILGWQGWVWEVVKYVAVVGLIWIFMRRMSRYRTRRQEKSSGDDLPGGSHQN